MLNIAVRAARKAGSLISRRLDRVEELPAVSKGRNDFVTEVDRRAERMIVETLLDAYPKHAVLAEESGARGSSPYLWIIDPLDGTTNFLHGFPQCAVSIALQHQGRIILGIVYDPLREELFTAERGGGAYLNERRIRVSHRRRLQDALLGTGFPFRKLERLPLYLNFLGVLCRESSGIRRPGAASLDLAYLACGRLDGFWELDLKPWDLAAGSLLVEEAGGLLSGLDGATDYLHRGDVLAGNRYIHKALLQAWKQSGAENPGAENPGAENPGQRRDLATGARKRNPVPRDHVPTR